MDIFKSLYMNCFRCLYARKRIPESSKTFSCVVCYEDGTSDSDTVSASGKIISKCNHDICVSCYTNILITNGKNALCPICRVKYYTVKEQVIRDNTIYRDLVIGQEDISVYAILNLIRNRDTFR